MHPYTQATPCPAPFAHPSKRVSQYGAYTYTNTTTAYQDDTTTNIEYTRELRADLRGVKPRRRPTAQRKPAAWDPATDIWADDGLAQQQQQQQHHQQKSTKNSRSSRMAEPRDRDARRASTLAQPAQRINLPPVPQQAPESARPTRRRVSAILADKGLNASSKEEKRSAPAQEAPTTIKKDPRRRTIYVPSEDTTIMTIHPGMRTDGRRRAKSPDLGLDLVTLSEEDTTELVPAMKQKSGASRKSLAAAPKRGPLQQSTKPHQGVSFAEDVVGKGAGKENVPPGMVLSRESKVKRGSIHVGREEKAVRKQAERPESRSAQRAATSSSNMSRARAESSTRKRMSSETTHKDSPSKALKAKLNATAGGRISTRESTSKRVPSAKQTHSSPFHTTGSPPQALRRNRVDKPPSKLSVPQVSQRARESLEKYPVLSEDLDRPELYEDSWLTYQEVAITQLLNKLYDSVKTNTNVFDADDEDDGLRKRLLAIYQEAGTPLLHKRLQASLLYGALSIPKDLLAKASRVKDDVGMRRRYLDLFVETYDLSVLKAAAETIVGRKIPVSSRLSSASTASDSSPRRKRAEKKSIENFILAFYVRHEDAVRVKTGFGSIASIAHGKESKNDDFGSQGWAWRRTVLRSLMLVLLLDTAKSRDTIPQCLFQDTSPRKSSISVLQALADMLLPSLGDLSRPLGHLNYRLQCVQYPLQEYSYHIDNLAIDLRDGVLLTRLVELLLYTPSTLALQKDLTITMPTGEILTSTLDLDQKESWALSQHLKFPCIGRAQKLYNVQIALSALQGVRGIPGHAVHEVTAEDVVDGHREKTLGLLWSLVGKWGLATLVDRREVEREIQRFRQQFYATQNLDYLDPDTDSESETTAAEPEGLECYTVLLRSWARSIARLHGLRVANLTTSFASGAVLEAIVDQYSGCFPAGPSSTSTSTSSLPTKLQSIGCSNAFISLFLPSRTSTSTTKPIPSKDFTLTSLAFLAARLLPASRAHRAAATIQSAYRMRLARREATKRVQLMRLARHCETVVKTRERVVGAATVLQRAWRRVLDRRIAQLVGDVVAFQRMARGWAVRRGLGRKGKRSERVRGGW